jgi:hypothetical protein
VLQETTVRIVNLVTAAIGRQQMVDFLQNGRSNDRYWKKQPFNLGAKNGPEVAYSPTLQSAL